MADRFWSISAGQEKTQVAETGSTTAGADVEIRVTYTSTPLLSNKQLVMRLIELLEARIIEDTWPPA